MTSWDFHYELRLHITRLDLKIFYYKCLTHTGYNRYIYIYILNIIYKYFNISFISFSICNRDSLEHEFFLSPDRLNTICFHCHLSRQFAYYGSQYLSMTRIPRYSTSSPYQLEQIKNHWSHLPRCNLQNVIRNYATWSAPAIPPSRAPINSPAAAPACRCAFKVNRVSRYAPLSWSHARFIERSLTEPLYASSRPPSTATLTFSLECRRQARNVFKTIRTRVPATARPGSTKRLRCTGAAPALRV